MNQDTFANLTTTQLEAMVPFKVLTKNEVVHEITNVYRFVLEAKSGARLAKQDVMVAYGIQGSRPLTKNEKAKVTLLRQKHANTLEDMKNKFAAEVEALEKSFEKCFPQDAPMERLVPSKVEEYLADFNEGVGRVAYLQPTTDGIQVMVRGANRGKDRINYERVDNGDFGRCTEVFIPITR